MIRTRSTRSWSGSSSFYVVETYASIYNQLTFEKIMSIVVLVF